MKKLIVFIYTVCLLTFSPAFAGFMLEGEYSQLYWMDVTNRDSNLQPGSASGSLDERFFGVGARYVFRVWDGLRLEPFVKYIGQIQKPNIPPLRMAEGGLSIGYQLGSLTPFASLLETYTFDNGSGPGQQLQFGYQLGFRYSMGAHSISITHSWRQLRNEWPPMVYDQTIKIPMWSVGYGFEFE